MTCVNSSRDGSKLHSNRQRALISFVTAEEKAPDIEVKKIDTNSGLETGEVTSESCY